MKVKYDTSTEKGKAQVIMEFAETGKPVFKTRRLINSQWVATEIPNWNWHEFDFNYPAKPKLVRWTLKTVPKCAMWLRHKGGMSLVWPLELNQYAIIISGRTLYYSTLFENWEYSSDNGATWLPCGTESQEDDAKSEEENPNDNFDLNI